jgi:hypothetical protein
MEAWQRQIQALRRMTPQQRLAAGMAMSDDVRALLAAGIRARHPGYTDAELRDAVVDAFLGNDRDDSRAPRRSNTGQ